MLGRRKKVAKQDAELDITSFMNLMIVLVPVLLMMMVFSRITVLELSLPELSVGSVSDNAKQRLEVIVRQGGIELFYPQGYLVKTLPNTEDGYDYQGLQTGLKQIKQALINKDINMQQATLMLEQDIPYQVIVSLMDTTRSYQDVLVTSVVDAELFPEISLADAPPRDSQAAAKGR